MDKSKALVKIRLHKDLIDALKIVARSKNMSYSKLIRITLTDVVLPEHKTQFFDRNIENANNNS